MQMCTHLRAFWGRFGALWRPQATLHTLPKLESAAPVRAIETAIDEHVAMLKFSANIVS